jgi:hypothetical protein
MLFTLFVFVHMPVVKQCWVVDARLTATAISRVVVGIFAFSTGDTPGLVFLEQQPHTRVTLLPEKRIAVIHSILKYVQAIQK